MEEAKLPRPAPDGAALARGRAENGVFEERPKAGQPRRDGDISPRMGSRSSMAGAPPMGGRSAGRWVRPERERAHALRQTLTDASRHSRVLQHAWVRPCCHGMGRHIPVRIPKHEFIAMKDCCFSYGIDRSSSQAGAAPRFGSPSRAVPAFPGNLVRAGVYHGNDPRETFRE